MFFITTIFNPGEERERATPRTLPRAFGYFEKEGKAREAVENNYGSIQECLYTHVVIEYPCRSCTSAVVCLER
jgi:hypothetical protein